MKKIQIATELKNLEKQILSKRNRKPALLTRDWAKQMQPKPGVYAWFRGETLIYVGESGNLAERLDDSRRTWNHTLRRAIGEAKYSKRDDYTKATSGKRYSDKIEILLNRHMQKLRVSVLVVEFGRTELEEHLIEKYEPIYNKKRRRA